MKKKNYLAILLLLTAAAGLSGCKEKEKKDLTPAEPIIVTDAAYIEDQGNVIRETDKEMYLMKVQGSYLNISGDGQPVMLEAGGQYPEMKDGQIARVTADISVYNYGGEEETAGSQQVFISSLKEFRFINYTEAFKLFSFPDVRENDFDYSHMILGYESDSKDKHYILVMYGTKITVYESGKAVLDYEYEGLDKEFTQFWDFVHQNEIFMKYVFNNEEHYYMEYRFVIQNNSKDKYTFKEDNTLEKYANGKWTPVEMNEYFEWDDIDYELEPGKSQSFKIFLPNYDRDDLMDENAEKFRVAKKVKRESEYKTETIYADVTIDRLTLDSLE